LSSSSGEHWDVLSLPAIAEQDESFRRKGEALWPEWFPLSELERIRAAIGERPFVSLYQQRPSAAEGAIFKRNWWHFYRHPLAGPFRIIQSWDTAFKTGEENDYSVCTTWGVSESGYFLLHLWRGKGEFPALKRKVIELAQEWKPTEILVEDRASGQSLIQELRRSTLPIKPVKSDRDKQSRAQAITPIIEAGKVFLPENAPWLPDFLDEMASFPNGLHDDIVDSTSQALNYLRQRNVEVTDDTVRLILGISDSEELDKEELWAKALRGCPMTPEEIDRM
jgi:predicted phage terminase large subunit-like protein